MKKVVCVLLVLSGLGGIATACSGSDESGSADPSTTVATTASTTVPTTTTTTTTAPIVLTAAQVVEGLRSAGLPVGAVTVFTETTDPNTRLGRPGQYSSKASFADTRIGTEVDGVEGGGDVEAFDDAGSLSERADYLAGFADGQLLGGWYQYTAGNAILRLAFDLTPDQAKEYETALQNLYK